MLLSKSRKKRECTDRCLRVQRNPALCPFRCHLCALPSPPVQPTHPAPSLQVGILSQVGLLPLPAHLMPIGYPLRCEKQATRLINEFEKIKKQRAQTGASNQWWEYKYKQPERYIPADSPKVAEGIVPQVGEHAPVVGPSGGAPAVPMRRSREISMNRALFTN